MAEETRGEPGGEDKVEQGLELLEKVLETASAGMWKLQIDGELFRQELIGVEAMNVRELGPNLPLAPDADPGDGLLDVVLLRPDDRPQLAAYVSARLRDESADLLHLDVRRGTRLRIEPPAEHPVHADDVLSPSDSHGSRRVEIRPAAAQIEVLVPAITEQVT